MRVCSYRIKGFKVGQFPITFFFLQKKQKTRIAQNVDIKVRVFKHIKD